MLGMAFPPRAELLGSSGTALSQGSTAQDFGDTRVRRRSLHAVATAAAARGPIPAGAGEPSSRPAAARASAAYPRGCGGAAIEEVVETVADGLSPRVRGSLQSAPGRTWFGRPIPAGAGEPGRIGQAGRRPSAYPRGCGGARWRSRSARPRAGLSPRVRGSPGRRPKRELGPRPIPAGAGEPKSEIMQRVCAAAYPRGCGGAGEARLKHLEEKGLSPRVRGSPAPGPRRDEHRGPIPAGAGEP